MNSIKYKLNRLPKALLVTAMSSLLTWSASAFSAEKLEKDNLKFGFIKLTDMAPLAVAFEKGFFEDEGLSVQVEAQANWQRVGHAPPHGFWDGFMVYRAGRYAVISDDCVFRTMYEAT